MKLTKQLRSEILDVYEAFWGSLFNVDIEIYSEVLDDNYRLIGTTEKEVFFTKREAISFLKATAEQLAGNIERRKSKIKLESIDSLVLVTEQFDAYVLIENKWTFYGKTRVSTWMQQKQGGWRLVQQHFSFPDIKAGEGQTIGLEKIAKENLELREAIKRRTAELEYKNRELEIEAALERVRARTMAMQNGHELSETAKVLFEQFTSLGYQPDRFAIAIVNEGERVFDYWVTQHGGFFLDTSLKFSIDEPHVMQKMYQAWKTKTRSITLDLQGKSLKEYFQFLANSNAPVNPDKFVERRIQNVATFSKGILTIISAEPAPHEVIELLERFAQVFDGTYTRFLDLKNAEAQAREAQIETALEKVRSASLAMHSSDELHKVIRVLTDQFTNLGFHFHSANFITNESMPDWEIWISSPGVHDTPPRIKVPYTDQILFNERNNAIASGKEFITASLNKEQKDQFFHYLFEKTMAKATPPDRQQWVYQQKGMGLTTVLMKNISLSVINYDGTLYSTEENEVIKRFAKVFEQSYTRFLDLQKAEAQAREAQIETGLERVRSKTMAMHKSDEVTGVAVSLNEELMKLGFQGGSTIIIINKESGDTEQWTGFSEDRTLRSCLVPYFKHSYHDALFDAWKKGEKFLIHTIDGEEKKTLDEHYFSTGYKIFPENDKKWMRAMGSVTFSHAFMKYGAIHWGPDHLTEEQLRILLRFSKVFEQSYTRFLDLKKAEAQVREANIEAALERVRSRTMAMHHSEEIADIVGKIFNELKLLDLVLNRVLIWIFNDAEKYIAWWSSNPEIDSNAESYRIDYNDQPVFLNYLQAWKNRTPLHLYTLSGDTKRKWEDHLFTNTELSKIPMAVRNGMREEGTIFTTSTISDYGLMMVGSFEPLSNESIDIIQRFGRVFQQSYTRYLDVQKAESQAREAQIEVAVERVRAKALAMHKSEDLHGVVVTLKKELMGLEISGITAATIFLEQDDGSIRLLDLSTAREEEDDKLELKLDKIIRIEDTDPGLWIRRIWYGTENYFVVEADEEDFVRVIAFLRTIDEQGAEMAEKIIKEKEIKRAWLPTVKLEKGKLNIDLLEPPVPEIESILLKMGAGFDLAYKRFLDLQKAEAQAREAQIEAALEKVRSRSLAMHKSEEMREMVKVVFERLKELNFAIDGGVFIGIPDTLTNSFNLWVGDDHAEYPTCFNLPYYDAAPIADVWRASQDGSDFLSKIYSKEEKNKWFDFAFEHTDFKILPDQLKSWILEQEFLTQTFALAKYSGIGIHFHHYRELAVSEIDILKRFTKVFEQGYIRFLDLQKAEAQAREAEIELGLERVRARAMAMQRSDELSDLVDTVFKELIKLDFALTWCIINIIDEPSLTNTVWAANPDIDKAPDSYYMKFEDYPFHHAMMKGYQERNAKCIYVIEGQEKKIYDEYLFTETEFRKVPAEAQAASRAMERYVVTFTFSNFGGLQTVGDTPLSEASLDILSRFGKVFDLTYTRFNDLRLAEAQAREAKIEAALEKVRSRSLAMHKSDELQEVVHTVIGRLTELNVEVFTTIIITFTEDSKDIVWWLENKMSDQFPHILLKYEDNSYLKDVFEARKNEKELFSKCYVGQEKKELYEYLFGHTDLRHTPENQKAFLFGNEFATISIAFAKNTAIHITSYSKRSFSEEETDILKRFTKVFDQAYTRFLDLQKAEAQVRENQVQLALERARAQSMMMQHSTELDDTLRVFHEQVLQLGIPSAFSFLWLPDEQKDRHIFWAAWAENNSFKSKAINYPLDRNEPATAQCLIDWKSNEPVVSYHVPPDGVENYFAVWHELIAGVEHLQPQYFQDGLYYVEAFIKYGCFGIMVKNELTEDEKKIMNRFAIEFERTYTRFLDLKKTEAQARESQIQLALERVRARTMAMQKSEELPETSHILFEQMKELGEPVEQLTIGVVQEENKVIEISATLHGDILKKIYQHSLDEPFMMSKIYHAWKTHQKTLIVELKGDELNAYNKYRNELTKSEMFPTNLGDEHRRIVYAAFFSKGMLALGANEPRPPESLQLLERFAGVFDQAYVRFIDLKNAEAQAREAQIEAALEKVRSRTMGMQKSTELKEVIQIVYDQFVHLNINVEHTGFIIDYKERDDMNIWLADKHEVPFQVTIPYFDSQHWNSFNEAKQKGTDFFANHLNFEEKNKFYQDLFKLFPVPDNTKEYYFNCPGLAISTILLDNVGLYIENFSGIPYTEEENNTLMRFGKVFQQTYTRFLDLQKAEAQAREAQIETALEKVRSRSLAMHSPKELEQVVIVIVEKLKELGVVLDANGVVLCTYFNNSKDVLHWIASPDFSFAGSYLLPYFDHPIFKQAWESKESGAEYFSRAFSVEEKNSFFEYAFQHSDYKSFPDDFKKWVFQNDKHILSFAWQKNSAILIPSHTGIVPAPDQVIILKRFSRVFEQAYIRFMDLQKAEAQAREALIEAALERVRARALAMQEPEELKDVAQVLRNEMGALGVEELETCSIYIHEKDSETAECWYALKDPKETEKKMVADHFHLELNDTWVGREMKKFYSSNEKQISIVMQGANRKEWINYCYKQSPVFSGFYGEIIPDRSYHLYKFSYGYIGAAAPGEISAESWRLLSRAASVFSLAYSRFKDLTQARNDLIKLKEEKKRAEDALTELQVTQKQLIQSEKMASLGELTAGIAHEIQNPLNFVNNFSDVSNELIEELKIKNEKLKIEDQDVKELLNDISQNLEKISHHGKRADAIVKGMLQHSRSSSGQKELTDINTLAEEYIRLAYHGLRAKDKFFNAKFETNLDPSLNKINVVPQEIGRVILNLINNSFYAVNEKKKSTGNGYEPMVTISTKAVKPPLGGLGVVEISVKDNGNGIPQKVLDKIFQPFFTTKPTGQGTGLGLSLSYDIITKGHDGDIKVETKEGEGSEFIISLPVN